MRRSQFVLSLILLILVVAAAVSLPSILSRLQVERMLGRVETASMEETPADVIAHARESAKAKVRPAQHVSPVMVLGFAAVAVMLVMLVMSYVELTAISGNVVQMQSELETLQTQQVSLITKHEQAFDLSGVKEAATEAGMSQPSDSQIYYIDLSEPDSATVYSQEESGFGKILSMLGQGICTVVEYFR